MLGQVALFIAQGYWLRKLDRLIGSLSTGPGELSGMLLSVVFQCQLNFSVLGLSAIVVPQTQAQSAPLDAKHQTFGKHPSTWSPSF